MSSQGKRFAGISTFSGCGGSSLGYKMAGGRVLLAVEFDRHAISTYRENFPETPVYPKDIATLTVDDALKMTGLNLVSLIF